MGTICAVLCCSALFCAVLCCEGGPVHADPRNAAPLAAELSSFGLPAAQGGPGR